MNNGTIPSSAWKTLERVNRNRFVAGDRVLFHSGCRWKGQLSLHDSGSAEKPIQVDRYAKGEMPRIDGDGQIEDALQIQNAEYIEVRHMEITNHGDGPGTRRGVLIALQNFGTAHHLVISDLYIHDVNGSNAHKETGGILFRTTGDARPSRFDGLTIERNIVWKVDRSAIVGQSSQTKRSKWYPSLHVVIRDNYVENIGGDGIVPWATEKALIEHNIVLHCNQRANSYNAGIWPWSADDSLFQLNEAAFTHSTLDGEGFDSDYNSRNTHFRYNYSHDNEGGFMLICTPVKRNPEENIGNTGTVIAYNISRNDHTRIFNLSGADNTSVEHNAIYGGASDDLQVLLVSRWDGWSSGAIFKDNTFNIAGTGRYGHEVGRNEDGTYRTSPGWGGAEGIEFVGNRYFGNNLDLPQDSSPVVDRKYHPVKLDWREPVFDPAHPQGFSRYLVRHRRWLLRLFRQQFGAEPQLGADSAVIGETIAQAGE